MAGRDGGGIGRTGKVMIAPSAVLIVVAVAVGIHASRTRQAFPERGAASLPAQAAGAGVAPGARPGAE